MSDQRVNDPSGWRRRLCDQMIELIPMLELMGHYCDTGQLDEAIEQAEHVHFLLRRAKRGKASARAANDGEQPGGTTFANERKRR